MSKKPNHNKTKQENLSGCYKFRLNFLWQKSNDIWSLKMHKEMEIALKLLETSKMERFGNLHVL